MASAVDQWRQQIVLRASALGLRSKAADAHWQWQQQQRMFHTWQNCTVSGKFDLLHGQQAAYWWLRNTLEDSFRCWRQYTEFHGILSELMAQADFRYYHKSYSD